MVTFELTQKTALSVAFDVTIRGGGGGEPYDGPYTVTPETLLSGVTAHDAAGNSIVGTSGGGVTWYSPVN